VRPITQYACLRQAKKSACEPLPTAATRAGGKRPSARRQWPRRPVLLGKQLISLHIYASRPAAETRAHAANRAATPGQTVSVSAGSASGSRGGSGERPYGLRAAVTHASWHSAYSASARDPPGHPGGQPDHQPSRDARHDSRQGYQTALAGPGCRADGDVHHGLETAPAAPGFRWLPNRYPPTAPAFAAWQFPERRAG